MELAEYSTSGLRIGEGTTSLHREEVAQPLKTAKDEQFEFQVAKVHGGSAQPIRH